MDPMIWYLGPAGDLRPLVCPEPGIRTTEIRYGGIHQGLSGARSVDVTGIKAEFQFNWEFLEDVDWNWLRAMHTRLVPGPFWLINPMRKNRLTVGGAACEANFARYSGVVIAGGSWTMVYDVPSGVGPIARSLKWTGRTSGAALRFDPQKNTIIFPEEQITASVYLKAESSTTMRIVVDWFDRDGAQISSSTYESCALTTSWQRFDTTVTAPAGAFTARFAMYESSGASFPNVFVAAPQVEAGDTATEWEHGGGAPMVLMDQLDTSSPRYPFTDCTLTLLEA